MWRLIGLLPLDDAAVAAHRAGRLGFQRTVYHQGPEQELRRLYARLLPAAVVLELVQDGQGVVCRHDRLAGAVQDPHPVAEYDQDDLAALGAAVLGSE